MATVEERFWAKVQKRRNGCWEWAGALSTPGPNPYGRFWDGMRLSFAHRFAYELVYGKIPSGLQIDHLCRNTRCVNAAHLEAVTPAENGRRSPFFPGARMHCPRGHVYDADNTYLGASGSRECRRCKARKANIRRRKAGVPERGQSTATHCPKGHPWTEATRLEGKGYVRCRLCSQDAVRRYRVRKRLALQKE